MDWIALSKARIQIISLLGAELCLVMAYGGIPDPALLIHLAIGLTGTSCAASAINQILEVNADRKMNRTENRPLPTGRISLRTAWIFSAITGLGGLAWCALFINPLTAWLALVMIVTYDFIYTPLKRKTPLNTIVGAVPGAMPLLIGWASAGRGLDMMAGILFAILFVWQLPHFLAIAWMFREDYEKGGMLMLSNAVHPDATSRQGVQGAILLLPASLLPLLAAPIGKFYFYGALSSGLFYLALVIHFGKNKNEKRARRVLHASIIHLPLLLGLLAWDWFSTS
jgi:protoheme IX farnesyltransferase